MERICLLCIAICLGVLYLPLSWLMSPMLCYGLVLFALVMLVGGLWRKNLTMIGGGVIPALMGLWCIATASHLWQQQQTLNQLVGTTQSALIRIEKILHQGDYQTTISTVQFAPNEPFYRLYLTWQPSLKLQTGQLWQGNVTLKSAASRLNSGGFQRQKWLYANHIVGNGTVKRADFIEDQPQIRDYLLRAALSKLETQPSAGLLLALGFGEKYWLSHAQITLFQQTGTAHLIAISGLHIGLMMLLGVLLGRGVQYYLPTHWISPTFPMLLGAVCALIYSYLADFSIPTIRALTAVTLVLLLRWHRGYLNWWQLYIRTIALLLWIDPLMVLSDSFWLSVGAVGCLLIWHSLFPLSALLWKGKPLSKQGKIRYYLLGLLHLQIGLTLLFTPISVAFFHGINLQSLLINLWIVPLFSLLLIPSILFSIFTFDLFHSWHWCILLAEWSLAWLEPFQASWRPLSNTVQQWLALGCGIIGVFIGCYQYYIRQHMPPANQLFNPLKPQKISLNFNALPIINQLRYLIILLVLLSVWHIGLLSYAYYQQQRTLWTLEMLDVGQGLAILLRQGEQGILFDSGFSWASGSMAELEILPYLRREGIQLDKIILSHDDNDHSGGATSLLQAYPQAQLWSSSKVTYAGKVPQPCQMGTQFKWQNLSFTMLAPNEIVSVARNQHSCVVLIEDGQYRVLLTGDLDRNSELRYLHRFPQVDILQVAHHGSKTSSSQRFLQHISGKVALISSGLHNRWRFPHPEVLERLTQQHMKIFNTGWHGQIIVRFTRAKQLEITTQRQAWQAWFNQLPTGSWLDK